MNRFEKEFHSNLPDINFEIYSKPIQVFLLESEKENKKKKKYFNSSVFKTITILWN